MQIDTFKKVYVTQIDIRSIKISTRHFINYLKNPKKLRVLSFVVRLKNLKSNKVSDLRKIHLALLILPATYTSEIIPSFKKNICGY